MKTKMMFAAILAAGLSWSVHSHAQETVKIGVILPYSGPFADAANQLQAGIDLYIAKHGNEVAGKTIELVKKDTGGPAPDVAQRLAQELVVRDGVDIIAGFALTPEALGAAPIATEAQKLMVVMNAATSIVTEQSRLYRAHRRDDSAAQHASSASGRSNPASRKPIRSSPTTARAMTRKRPLPRASPKRAARSSAPTARRSPIPISPHSSSACATPIPKPSTSSFPAAPSPPRSARRWSTAALPRRTPRSSPRANSPTPKRSKAWATPPKASSRPIHYSLERDDPLNNEFREAYREANGGRCARPVLDRRL